MTIPSHCVNTIRETTMTQSALSNTDTLIYLRENNALPIVSVWAVEFAVTI